MSHLVQFKMENGFSPPRLLLSIISLCLAVNHSQPLEHVVFTAQPPEKIYTTTGQDLVLAWNFTLTSANLYKGIKYYVNKHGRWAVLGEEYKNGVRKVRPLYKGRVFIEDTGKLKIVNSSYNGTISYKIEVRCSTVDDVCRTVHVTVVDPPKITSSPQLEKAVTVGKPLQLNCSASGFPKPNVILKRGDTFLAMGCKGSVSWSTHAVSTEDEGTYTCLAWNYEKAKTDERTFRVLVKGSTANVVNVTKPMTLIEENTTGTLRWSYSLSEREKTDLANITLYRKETSQALERENLLMVLNRGFSKRMSSSSFASRISWIGSSISSEAVFSISKAEISDSGYYGISLGFSTQRQFQGLLTTQLLVGVHSKILNSPKNKTVSKGEPFVLECNVTGEPAPRVRWLKDGAEIRGENSGPALKVRAADKQSGGTYVCEAVNAFGTERVAFAVNVADTAQKKDPHANSKTSAKSTSYNVFFVVLLVVAETLNV